MQGGKGDKGDAGLASAMQSITVGDDTFTPNTLTSVVFPGATADLTDGVLTLDSMQGDSIKGDPGLDSAMQSITVGDQTFTSNSLTSVVCPGAEPVSQMES